MITQEQRLQKMANVLQDAIAKAEDFTATNPKTAYGIAGGVGGFAAGATIATARKQKLRDVIKTAIVSGALGAATGVGGEMVREGMNADILARKKAIAESTPSPSKLHMSGL